MFVMLIPLLMYAIWLFSGAEKPSLLWAIPLTVLVLAMMLAVAYKRIN